MSRRSIGAALILAALLLVPSCDAESLLRGFGTNVLGGVDSGETVNQVNEMIEAGITEYDDLVRLVVEASRNPDTEKKLVDTLSETAPESAAESIRSDVSQLSSQLESADTESLPVSVRKQAEEALNAVEMIADGLSGTGNYKPTKGDVAIIQAAESLVSMVMDSGIGSDGTPSDDDINSLINTANSALKMFNTIKPSTAFRNVDLNSVINELVSAMGQGSAEGGEEA